MKVVHSWANLSKDDDPTILTIGVFDGVHLGHQALIRGVVQRARSLDARAIMLTFHPHPRSVIAPKSPWGYICSLEERLARIAELGPDVTIVLRFSPDLADMPAERFVHDLCRHIPLRELHVGADFFLGKGGKGDLRLLRVLGQRWGFAVQQVPPVLLDGRAVSSTHIRERIQAGQVGEAGRWLGRPFCLRGQVVSGARQGRLLGFPTANLYLHPRQILPADGVYAVWVHFPPATSWLSPCPGLGYVGRRPTFAHRKRGVEVHLLDFSADLVGYELRLEFAQHLRPDQTFSGPEELIAQIRRDEERVRGLLD